jgi:hypothetical protein
MKSLRAYVAAAAIAIAGFAGAGTADAKPLLVGPSKLALKLCIPHFEKKVVYAGIVKIGFRYYRVYKVYTIYVNRFCFKHVVSVKTIYVPLPWFHHKAPAGV